MSEPYIVPAGSRGDPATTGFAITKHDSTNFTNNCRAIYFGTGGTAVVVCPDGTELTFTNIPDGFLLPVAAKRVNSTNTTASDMVGLR